MAARSTLRILRNSLPLLVLQHLPDTPIGLHPRWEPELRRDGEPPAIFPNVSFLRHLPKRDFPIVPGPNPQLRSPGIINGVDVNVPLLKLRIIREVRWTANLLK